MKSLVKLMIVVFTLTSVAACTGVNTVQATPIEMGKSIELNEGKDLVKLAVLATLSNEKAKQKKVTETSDGITIIYSRSVSALSWGQVGRVFIKPLGKNKTRVYIHSEKRSKFEITGEDTESFEQRFLSGLEQAVKTKN